MRYPTSFFTGGLIDSEVEDDALYRSKPSSAVEIEANRLAADILMPFALIRKLQNGGITDLVSLRSTCRFPSRH